MEKENSNKAFLEKEGLKSYIFNSAKYYASKLVKAGHYNFNDIDDLEQEILALFYCRIKKYEHDASKSSEKYWINIIMDGIYGNLVEKAEAHNKLFSKRSLNDYAGSNNSNSNNNDINNKEIIEFIEDNQSDTFENYCKIKQEELIIKAMEILPEDLKDLCRYLQNDNVTDISKKLGVSRKTIYQRINKIKKVFEELGVYELF